MAAIERKTIHLSILLPLGVFMILGYQNCSVDHRSMSTPGASSIACEADQTTLDEFEAVFATTLNTTGNFPSGHGKCAHCHGDVYEANGSGGFIIYMGDTTANPELVKKNYCSVVSVGSRIATHPQSISHGGEAIPASDFQDLINWANENL